MAKLPRIPEGWKAAGDPESVTVESSPPPSDGAKWEAKAYFINPLWKGGNTASPKSAVHGGIKIYRNGEFVSSIDAGPQTDHAVKDGTLGNLVFDRAPDSLSANNKSALADKADNGEITLTPPKGVSPQNFAQALMMAAKSYDESLRYSLPPLATVDYAASDVSDPFCSTGMIPQLVRKGAEMRLLTLTFLAVVAAMGIQWGLVSLPDSLDRAMHGFTLVLVFLLPAIATAGIAYRMGIWSWYVFFLSILSPSVSAILLFFTAANVLHRPMYFW